MAEAGAEIPLPPHAYVPGQNTRHPEDWFDAIKDSVRPGMSPADLGGTRAFRAGLIYLKAGYFWECHEVLEAVWMQAPDGSAEREMVQALIQLANARLKVAMHRPRAALRLCDMVEGHLDRIGRDGAILGIPSEDIRAEADAVRAALKSK